MTTRRREVQNPVDARMRDHFIQPTTILNTTPIEKSMLGAPLPCSVYLHSLSSTGRKIEVSLNDGTTYEEVTYALDGLNADGVTYQKRVTFYTGVSDIRITGDANDTFGAR